MSSQTMDFFETIEFYNKIFLLQTNLPKPIINKIINMATDFLPELSHKAEKILHNKNVVYAYEWRCSDDFRGDRIIYYNLVTFQYIDETLYIIGYEWNEFDMMWGKRDLEYKCDSKKKFDWNKIQEYKEHRDYLFRMNN